MNRFHKYMSVILFLHFLLPLQAQERKSNDMFRYAIGASSIDTSLFNNLSSARKLKNFFDSLNASPDASIRRVEIFSSASMEGDVTSNRKLNMLRNETVKSVLKKMSDIPDSLIQCVDGGVAWEELRNAVDTSGMQYKEEVLYILDNEPEETWEHGVLVDSRNKHLMDLRGGRPYNYMRKTFFPAFRYTRISIVYSGNVKNYGKYEKDVLEDAVADEGTEKEAALMVEITRDSSEAKTGMERVISDTLPQTPKDTVIYVPETVPEKTAGSSVENVHDRQPSVKKDSPMFAVKTNVLLLGAGVANAGVEARITDRFSFDFPVIYSPYTIKNNYYTILRTLGATYSNVKKIINVELFIYYNLAFFTILLIFYLIKNNILNFKYIENLIQYITVYETILMYIILFLMSRLIAKNVSKNIFKETVISSFNREV